MLCGSVVFVNLFKLVLMANTYIDGCKLNLLQVNKLNVYTIIQEIRSMLCPNLPVLAVANIELSLGGKLIYRKKN